jgi:hypothetical protein
MQTTITVTRAQTAEGKAYYIICTADSESYQWAQDAEKLHSELGRQNARRVTTWSDDALEGGYVIPSPVEVTLAI